MGGLRQVRTLVVALLTSFWLGPAAVHGQPQARTLKAVRSVETAVDGLQLSLGLTRSTFPRDALAKANVRARNISAKTIYIWTPGPEQGGVVFPEVEVTNGSGQSVYPP